MFDFRRAFGVCVAIGMLAGCRGSQPPVTAPVAMPQGHAVAANAKRPVANPTSLFFYSRKPLKFTVTQTNYDGRFTMSDPNCEVVASVSPESAEGPKATFKVTPIETPSGASCVVSVANDRGRKAKVRVGNPGY